MHGKLIHDSRGPRLALLTGLSLLMGACGSTASDRERFSFGEPILEIGVMDGPPQETLGVIGDLTVGIDGDLFVLDIQAKTVHRVRADTILEQIGGPGGGPGEFTTPIALWMWPPNELMIVDPEARRLTVYDVTTVPARYARSLGFEWAVEPGGNGCEMEGRLYLNAFDGKDAIQVLDGDGVRVGAMAEVPIDSTLPPVLQHELRMLGGIGKVTCVPEEHLVIFLPEWQPRVVVFAVDGAVTAEWSLSDYEQFTARQTASGGTGFGPDPETGEAHRDLGATWLGSGRFVIQLGKVGDEREREEGPVEHRVFDLTTGEVVRLLGSAPRFPVFRDGIWYGYRNLPFPQVQVWAGQGR